MWHVRISERLQNSQPKVFFEVWISVAGMESRTIQLPTTLLLRLFNQKQETNSVWQCHAMPRQIVLERPGCQHCTSAQSGAAQGSLETLCGGSESGAVELNMSSPELLNQVGPWALHCLKSMLHLKWLTMGLPKNKWGIATTSRASGATATGEVRGHGVVFPLQGAFTPCFCVKMRRSQPQTLGPMPKSWRLLQRAFSHFLPNWALTFLNKIPASVASGSQGLIKNTQEIYIPDFFDEEFDQRYDVPGLWKCGLSQLSRRLYIADIKHYVHGTSCVHTPHWYAWHLGPIHQGPWGFLPPLETEFVPKAVLNFTSLTSTYIFLARVLG